MPLGFANVVSRGDIGIIGASGTGIQEVSTLIARVGGGISHAIGTGGRDLKTEVGAVTTLMAIDALDADAQTKRIVVISKPPAAAVARLVLDRLADSPKSFVVCFLGAYDLPLPPNARAASTLKAAAELATEAPMARQPAPSLSIGSSRGKLVRGLFAGGTLCTEVQVVFRQAGLAVASNVPAPGALPMCATGSTGAMDTNLMIDLGDDQFTRGRPHPMIDPAVRDRPLAEALADPAVGVILLDVVLGYGAHADPAGHLAGVLAGIDHRPLILACVTGTDDDPQRRSAQVAKLIEAGVTVADCNADAAAMAVKVIGG
jgi:FdrA protein